MTGVQTCALPISDMIEIVPTFIIRYEQELLDLFNSYLKDGFEGVVAKNFNGKWVDNRSYDCLKWKNEDNADLKVIDADLSEIDLAKERRKRKKEQAMARTIQQLVELGKRRGLAKPAEWAAIYYAARYNRRPSAAEFSEAKRYL